VEALVAAVGWVGLGKLGGPCSAALAHYGDHEVYGYDPVVATPDTAGLDPITRCVSVDEVVKHTDDVVFVAVQTPHVTRFDGARLLPAEVIPEDFEYGYLVNAVSSIARAAERARKDITVAIISTVLPGTTNRELRPLLNPWTRLVYHPFFIAMGTVVEDYTKPEFVLLGADDYRDAERVADLYDKIHNAPAQHMSIASAELTKVAYNTFISTKIVFANTIAQLADVTGADVDEVTGALAHATDRIISPKYMTAGMGDGGGCHPRDNIALSAIAQRHSIADFMGGLNVAREEHTRWLASVAVHWSHMSGLPIVILGKSYKPEVAMLDGSPALLLADILDEAEIPFTHLDGYVDQADAQRLDQYHVNSPRAVFFIATKHQVYARFPFPAGSVVIDPFGFIASDDTIVLVRPGRKSRES
jgi:UDPglucose 6-dehydrogenase